METRLPKLTASRIPSVKKPPAQTVTSTKPTINYKPTMNKYLPKTFNKPIPVSATREALKDLCQKPIKRPLVPSTISTDLKKVKPTFTRTATTTTKTTTSSAITKSKAPAKSLSKPAPYDYKARFNLLTDKYDKLRTEYDNMKEEHRTVTDENEELLTRFDGLTKKSDKYDELKPIHDTLTLEHNVLNNRFHELQNKFNINEQELSNVKMIKNDLEQKFEVVNSELITKNNQLEESNRLIEDMIVQLKQFDSDRRGLHNQIQDLKGNIRVFCRVRPQLKDEKYKLLSDMTFVDEKTIQINKGRESLDPRALLSGRGSRVRKCEFNFDRVFDTTSKQEDIFEELAELIQSALDGFNVCVFAYGQTGSGKTYTMEGADFETNSGMIPRAINLLFETITSSSRLGWTHEVSASFVEIYNESIYDLLDPGKNHHHEIRMTDTKGTNIYVTHLTEPSISCSDELKKYFKLAQRNRAVAATENNERSSRSHSVTKITLKSCNIDRGERYLGSLNLIDLAGSERLQSGDTLRIGETKNINKSLANLSKVILALTQKQDHIPYRDSKLTHLLMPCLGGNSKTLMLVNVAPVEDCINETLNSLRFASTVNQCKTGVVKRNRSYEDLKSMR